MEGEGLPGSGVNLPDSSFSSILPRPNLHRAFTLWVLKDLRSPLWMNLQEWKACWVLTPKGPTWEKKAILPKKLYLC